jgi:hypothetical protein
MLASSHRTGVAEAVMRAHGFTQHPPHLHRLPLAATGRRFSSAAMGRATLSPVAACQCEVTCRSGRRAQPEGFYLAPWPDGGARRSDKIREI